MSGALYHDPETPEDVALPVSEQPATVAVELDPRRLRGYGLIEITICHESPSMV